MKKNKKMQKLTDAILESYLPKGQSALQAAFADAMVFGEGRMKVDRDLNITHVPVERKNGKIHEQE